jgi:hypothetical protein
MNSLYYIHQGLNTSLASRTITPQPALRKRGFGGHFEDTPPPYIEEVKEDNKIERRKKPKEKKKKTKKEKEKIREEKPKSTRKIVKE